MNTSRHRFSRWACLLLLAAGVLTARAQTSFSIGISVPGVSIGIQTPQYPQFVRVPSYPVYYAPQQGANLFFYDGLYWAYQRDNWYSSSWYDGPWYGVSPQHVPVYVLRIPVRYYRDPPGYFRSWQPDAPPHWDEHWGHDWQRQRRGWDRWDRSTMPTPAPLPRYQSQYSGERYPRVEQQQELRSSNYRYQPRDAKVRRQDRDQAGDPMREQAQRQPPGQARQRELEGRPSNQPEAQNPRAQAQPAQNRGNAHGNANGHGKSKGRDKDEERGKGNRN